MSVLIFIAVLVVLIVVHEFGHFIVAKAAKMRVDEFGIGFPPKLFGKRKGETEYTVNALPFGGFVRIFGEDKASVSQDDPDLERAFFTKSKVKQALVLVAGVTANVLLAWVIFSAIFMTGTTVAEDDTNKGKLTDVAPRVLGVLPDSPASEAGIPAGLTVLKVVIENTEYAISSGEELTSLISSNAGEEITLVGSVSGEERSFTITPQTGLIENAPGQAAVGISVARVGTLKLPFFEAIGKSFLETGELLILITFGILGFLFSALTLSADLSQVAGPVGIAVLTGEAASLGFITLLQFTAFISLNLAVINLLPFPALDGGRLLFLGIEALTRKEIPARFIQVTNLAGFALLILLMLAVTYGDIVRIAG